MKLNFRIPSLSALLISMAIFTACNQEGSEWQGTIEVVDGVMTVTNPDTPIKGTILLELEKTLEINPFDYPDIGMENVYSARDKDGEVILYDPNFAEAHRFSSQGEYIGSMIRNGQGPGEFEQHRGFRVQFRNNQIWASSSGKLAKFSKEGVFIEEKKLERGPDVLVDDTRYMVTKNQMTEEGQLRKVTLVDLVKKKDIVFFEVTREWLIRKGSSAFTNDWATPFIHYTYCPLNNRVFIALNEEYVVNVYNLEGELSQIIRRPHKRVNVSTEGIELLMGGIIRNESLRWIIDAFPDTLAAIKGLKVLPKGYLAVYRIVGPKIIEMDVFDRDGKLVYILKPPEGISVENAHFYDFGLTTVITQEEYPVYYEFKVNNVPEIFTN